LGRDYAGGWGSGGGQMVQKNIGVWSIKAHGYGLCRGTHGRAVYKGKRELKGGPVYWYYYSPLRVL